MPIEPAALALVARAGAGSARDAQSILGQLIAGAGDEGVTYDLAIALLGFTDASLLDEVVDAIAANDGAGVFAALDKVMDSGHDPRRFLTDLLERFRDLVIVRTVPNAAASGLIEAPDDQAARMAAQAGRFGPADLVRLADIVDEGITAMKGDTDAPATRAGVRAVVAARGGWLGRRASGQARSPRTTARPRRSGRAGAVGGAGTPAAVADQQSTAEPTAPAPTADPRIGIRVGGRHSFDHSSGSCARPGGRQRPGQRHG